MPRTSDYFFKITGTDREKLGKYADNLGWFFDDDYENPLSFPAGLCSVFPDGPGSLFVTFVPTMITTAQISAYLSGLGIDAEPTEPVPPRKLRLIDIALYPFLFLCAVGILLFVWIAKRFGSSKRS